MRSKIVKLLLIILCMSCIFCLSSDNAKKSSKKSRYVIIKVTESFMRKKLNTEEKKYYTKKFVKIVRKSAHFTLYFILGLLVISFLIEYMTLSWKSIIITIVFVFIYATTDEIHQLFISGRSGELLDVLIDTCGGLFSIIVYNSYYKIRRRLYE